MISGSATSRPLHLSLRGGCSGPHCSQRVIRRRHAMENLGIATGVTNKTAERPVSQGSSAARRISQIMFRRIKTLPGDLSTPVREACIDMHKSRRHVSRPRDFASSDHQEVSFRHSCVLCVEFLVCGHSSGLVTPINTSYRRHDPQTVSVTLSATTTGWHRRRLVPARSQTLLPVLVE